MATFETSTPPATDVNASFAKRFGSLEGQHDLKGKTVRAGAFTFFSQFSKLAFYTISSIVLARLLTPKDFGLVGMVTAVTGFLSTINHAGLSTATVQRAEISHELISTVFWINIALACAMMLFSTVLAPVLVLFYREPRLYWITFAVALTFLLDAAGAQHLALLRRRMRFRVLAILDIVAMVVGVLAGIAAALAGLGYWSLVIMQLVTYVIPLLGSWFAEPWRPGLPRRGTDARSMLRFGGYFTGVSLLTFAFRNLDNVLIGWRWGAGALGFYQKAYGLLLLPINQLNAPIADVATSTLSRLNSDSERQRRYFINGYSISIALNLPVVITSAIFAGDIIPFMFGKQWTDSVRIFQLLSPAALIGVLLAPFYWLFVARGNTDRQFKMTVVWTSLILLSFVAGLRFGPEGVAIGFSTMSILLVVPVCLFSIEGTGIRFTDILQAIKYPAIAITVPSAVGILFRINSLSWAPVGFRAIAGCAAVLFAYGFVLLVILRQWHAYRDLLSHLRPSRRPA